MKCKLRLIHGPNIKLILTAMEYLCHKWPRICPLVENTSRSFPHSCLITGFVTRLTRRVSLVEQDLPTYRSTWVHSLFLVGFLLLDLLFYVDHCVSFWIFSFGHCVVCSSLTYGFWLPLWYLQTLLKCNFILYLH